MKQYPSIPGSNDRKLPLGEPCIGFYKYDGSNLRWEWNRKNGFYKHGTRHRLFGVDEAPFNQALPLFEPIGAEVERLMLNEVKGLMGMTVYAEFFGPSSFAGTHDLTEPKELKVIDVWVERKGFVKPRRFIELFGEYPWAPAVVYEGNLNQQLIADARAGLYPLNEGMVCKGTDKRGDVWMAKVKTVAYLKRLQEVFGRDWINYAE